LDEKMKHEFTIKKGKGITVYSLGESDSGVTTSSSVGSGSVVSSLGGMQRRPEDSIFAQESKKDETSKPRNFVAKNAKMGGAGKMKDKSKTLPRHEKHKKPVAEGERTMSRAAKGHEKYGKAGMAALAKAGRDGAGEEKLDKIRDKHDKYNEGFNGEYDDEAGMAQSNLITSARAVIGLLKTIDDRDNLPEWAQEKIAKAEMMLVGVWDYLQSQKAQGINPQQDMEEGLGKMRGNPGAYDADVRASQQGFKRPSNHRDPEGEDDPRETMMWNLTINGEPLNPRPIMGRSNLIKFGKQQAAAGVDLSNAMISPVSNLKERTEVKDKSGKVVSWKDETPWRKAEKNKQGQPKDPRGTVTNLSAKARRETEKNVEEDDSALQAFLSKGGKVDKLPYKEPKTKDKANWGSKHIGTGKGGKAQNVSGKGANTRTGNKPVVSVEDAYMMELASMVAEKLNPSDPTDVWVQDFQKADPNKYHQFKKKTPAKKAQMAVAAHYAANEPSKKK